MYHPAFKFLLKVFFLAIQFKNMDIDTNQHLCLLSITYRVISIPLCINPYRTGGALKYGSKLWAY